MFVITGDHDLHSEDLYSGIAINEWTKTGIPCGSEIQVYYADETTNKSKFRQLLTELNPEVVYLNNIYSYRFFQLPLHAIRSLAVHPKIVICPRGMLKKSALAVKPFKKKVYFAYLKLTGLINNVHWHATSEEEAKDITKHFPANKGVVIAPNIPKAPLETFTLPEKRPGKLRLVFLSLISEIKNVLLLLQLVQGTDASISLDIYGPVIDEDYWKQCLVLIQQMPGKVQYKGDVPPAQVQEIISQYHLLILLTKGENFGHAIFESLSVGRPVITSYFTPWVNLLKVKAGANADISDKQDCLKQIQYFANMRQEEYNGFCMGAHEQAVKYYEAIDIGAYTKMFG